VGVECCLIFDIVVWQVQDDAKLRAFTSEETGEVADFYLYAVMAILSGVVSLSALYFNKTTDA
jgi:hypothetical protein